MLNGADLFTYIWVVLGTSVGKIYCTFLVSLFIRCIMINEAPDVPISKRTVIVGGYHESDT